MSTTQSLSSGGSRKNGKGIRSATLSSPRNNYVVRVTVLGLAGISVDRLRCRDKRNRPFYPAEPSKMKAVVAFSSANDWTSMKGITALSRNLVSSPPPPSYNQYVITTTRHVAVWTASDSGSMGSVVTFEAYLTPEEEIAKSFGLTIALAEDDDEQVRKVALPFGIASLPIRGGECKGGKVVTLDLPVSNLVVNTIKKTTTLNEKTQKKKKIGTTSHRSSSLSPSMYPTMIAISPKSMTTTKKNGKDVTSTNIARKRGVPFQKLFQKEPKVNLPLERQRKEFENTYQMDTKNGDAILRVSMEVYEKGSDLEKIFVARRLRGDIYENNYPLTNNRNNRGSQLEKLYVARRLRCGNNFATTAATKGDTSSDNNNNIATNVKEVIDNTKNNVGSSAFTTGKSNNYNSSNSNKDTINATSTSSTAGWENNSFNFFQSENSNPESNNLYYNSQTDASGTYTTTDASAATAYDTYDESVNTDFEGTTVGGNTTEGETSDDNNARTVHSDTHTYGTIDNTTSASDAEHSWRNNSINANANDEDDDDYTLSFKGKENSIRATSSEDDEIDPNKKSFSATPAIEGDINNKKKSTNNTCGESYHEMNIFGHKVHVPFYNINSIENYSCSVIKSFSTSKEETSSSSQAAATGYSVSTRLKSFVGTMKNEMNTITFNAMKKSKKIPKRTTTSDITQKISNKQYNNDSDNDTQDTAVEEEDEEGEANAPERKESTTYNKGTSNNRHNSPSAWASSMKDNVAFRWMRFVLCQQPEEAVTPHQKKEEPMDWFKERMYITTPSKTSRAK